ncbi:MAG: glycosyltransferase family 2 protein [Actinobacteria bacterium]|nr:glycosyltransferase family 2 protein [Actinomycetota bacterium]
MTVLSISALISLFLFLNAIANVVLLRRASPLSQELDTLVAVIVPLRNEAQNLNELFDGLQKQIGLKRVKFHLVNDNSTDDTFLLAQRLVKSDNRFFLHNAPPLAQDWLGKPATLQYGLDQSESEIVIFIDADVRLEKAAIARAVSTLNSLKVNFISAYPQQIARTWSESLVQPLLQWSWMATVPLRISERSKNPAFCVANGQFFVVERSALGKIEGLVRIRSAVLDDIFLARELVRAGLHGTVIDGSEIAKCRMYSSWSELREGYGKSLHVAFGGILGKFMAITLFLMTGVIPLVAAMLGSQIGFATFLAVTMTRVLSAITCRGKVWLSITHPLSMLLLIYLILRSWSTRKSVQWKGRTL